MQNGQRLQAIQGMNGVSMIAGSPVRHVGDGHLQMNAIDIRNYHQPPPAWKALNDFAMQNDLRLPLNGAGNMPGDPGHDSAGAFQQLVSRGGKEENQPTAQYKWIFHKVARFWQRCYGINNLTE